MRSIKSFVLPATILVALLGIFASSANAGNGTLTLAGTSCGVTFTSSGVPTDPAPTNITLSTVDEVPVPPCPFDLVPTSSFDLDLMGNGTLTADGTVRIQVTPLVSCAYNMSNLPGTNTASSAAFSGSANSLLCPSPATVAMSVSAF